MDAQNLQRGLRVREKLWRHENKAKRNRVHAELFAQILGPFAQAVLIKVTLPICGGGKFTVHEVKLALARTIANLEHEKF
jgi:hypothetical protein